MQSKFFILSKKEIKEAFTSSSLYLFAGIFTVMTAVVFYNNLIMTPEYTTRSVLDTILAPTFSAINFILLIFVPLITMGSFVGEKQRSTLNFLLLSNLSSADIYFGKFIAVFIKAIFLLIPTVIYSMIIYFSGFDDLMIIITNYIGILFLLGCYLSIGLFSSLVSKNYISSLILSYGLIFLVLIMFVLGSNMENMILSQFFKNLSFGQHMFYFSKGAIATFDITYFLSFIGFMAFVNIQTLGVKK